MHLSAQEDFIEICCRENVQDIYRFTIGEYILEIVR